MTRPMPAGRRRIDRVLAPEFVIALEDLTMEDLRARRRDAEQEEADLSYVRRLLQGRIDIIRAEAHRRAPSASDASLVSDLPDILSDEHNTTRGLGRHLSVEHEQSDEHRRREERLAGDFELSDVEARSDAELAAGLDALMGQESEVSEVRRDVQQVVDALSGELTRRYRDGFASVDTLLEP